MAQERDFLDRTVAFLQKRDGTDKLLKILRYSVKLLLATNGLDLSSEAAKRLKSFEGSVGVSRKALRLGKFLQDLNDFRRAPSLLTFEGILELLACGGEGVYYFIEQFVWLVKAGAIDKHHGPRMERLSALFELIGYVGSVTLRTIEIANLFHLESAIIKPSAESAAKQPAEGSNGKERAQSALRFKRLLKTLSLIQDISDSFLALADVLDDKDQPLILKNKVFLAAAGLLSAAISAHKNWASVS